MKGLVQVGVGVSSGEEGVGSSVVCVWGGGSKG